VRRFAALIPVLITTVAATFATPADASRSCGSVSLVAQPQDSAQVSVLKGSASCNEARSTARLYGVPRGTHGVVLHDFPGRSLDYATYPGGWQCGVLERGYAACVRGNLGSLRKGFTYTATRNAREQLGLRLV
jgi:hypothetical protein